MNQEQRDILEAAFGTLPAKEGYELVGVEMMKVEKGNVVLNYDANKWFDSVVDYNEFRPTAIFKKIEPTPKPTTLRDLMPEGNENVYVIELKGRSLQVFPERTISDKILLSGKPISSFEKHSFRWSHSIHTPYSEANEFVV